MRLTGDNKTDLIVLITVTVGACFVVWLLLRWLLEPMNTTAKN